LLQLVTLELQGSHPKKNTIRAGRMVFDWHETLSDQDFFAGAAFLAK
jgi:hypothetical protein